MVIIIKIDWNVQNNPGLEDCVIKPNSHIRHFFVITLLLLPFLYWVNWGHVFADASCDRRHYLRPSLWFFCCRILCPKLESGVLFWALDCSLVALSRRLSLYCLTWYLCGGDIVCGCCCGNKSAALFAKYIFWVCDLLTTSMRQTKPHFRQTLLVLSLLVGVLLLFGFTTFLWCLHVAVVFEFSLQNQYTNEQWQAGEHVPKIT